MSDNNGTGSGDLYALAFIESPTGWAIISRLEEILYHNETEYGKTDPQPTWAIVTIGSVASCWAKFAQISERYVVYVAPSVASPVKSAK